MDRLETFLAASEGEGEVSIALRALTLHMLRQVAPRLFRERGLSEHQRLALARCEAVDFGLAEPLDEDRLEAGVDAWYCRHLAGLPHRLPDAEALRAALQRLADGDQLIYAWLIGEQAARCGVDVRIDAGVRPFRHRSRTHDAYWLTHLVMLDTDYFARPLRHPEAHEWGEALAELVPWLLKKPNDDLAGEVALCLHFMGRGAPELLELLRSAAPTGDAHAQATVLLALSAE